MADADVTDLVEAVEIFKAHGVLPVTGGWQDQTYAFVQALRVIEREVHSVRQTRKERHKRGG